MIVTVNPVAGDDGTAGSPVILCNSTLSLMDHDFRVGEDRNVEEVQYPRGQDPAEFDRLNKTQRVTFKVAQKFDLQIDADRAVLDFTATVPAVGSVTIQTPDGYTRTMTVAQIPSVELLDYIGTTLIWGFTIRGSRFS